MTGENRAANIELERERWEAALRSAGLLHEAGEHADSVSRAYYAMLHAATAVLLTEGLEARTHSGVAHLLNLHFVRSGRFPPEQARRLTRLQAEREAADYDRAAVFTREASEDTLTQAGEFCSACRKVLEAWRPD
ncbi:MAG: HEPN domain-containing protein [Armatimonadetes bacterium]|nr:HEPN domain-containing protein [Armatimonadota bacterium]